MLKSIKKLLFYLLAFFLLFAMIPIQSMAAQEVINEDDTNVKVRIEIDYYTVRFESNGGSQVPSITNVAYGSMITAPNSPIKEGGWEFGGWYKEPELKTPWDFASDTVTANILLYAKWNKLGSDTGDVTSSTGETPKTGDENNVMLWLLLGGASTIVLVGMVAIKRKRRKYI